MSLSSSWIGGVDLKSIVHQVPPPVFIYSDAQLARNVHRVRTAAREAGLGDRVELYIPFFPNSNPHLFRRLRQLGVGVLVQVPGEYRLLRDFGFDDFIVSPGHIADHEIAYWSGTGFPTFLSSLEEVAFALRTNAPHVSVRIDSLGSGKPGVKIDDLAELAALLLRHGRSLHCLEVYCGSGNSLDEMAGILEQVLIIFQKHFPDATSVNFAGGHGFRYESWEEDEKHFAWSEYFQRLREVADRLAVPEHVRLLFEPARDVLADAGVLLLDVARDLIVTPVNNILVTNGTRMLMPSAQLRDRRHNVVFLDADLTEVRAAGTATTSAAVRGRTILRNDYLLPGEYEVPARVGADSHLLVMDVGAYCATQHMEFLNVPPAPEVMVDAEGRAHLISAAGGPLDRWRHLLPEKRALAAHATR